MASPTLTFTIFGINGLPLSGLSPTWETYRLISTGAPATGPAIVEVDAGKYGAVANPLYAGLADCGVAAVSRYQLFTPDRRVFAVFDFTGVPVTGLTNSSFNWENLYDTAAQADVSGSLVTVVELGGGLYFAGGLAPTWVGTVEWTNSASFPYCWDFDTPTQDAGPAIQNPQPAAGTILSGSALSVDVVPQGAALDTEVLSVLYPDGTREPIYDPVNGYWPLYAASGAPVSLGVQGGLRFRIVRGAPWQQSPTVQTWAIDVSAGSAQRAFTWNLSTPAPSPSVATQTVPSGGAAGLLGQRYGTDINTYLDGDLDPLLRTITDPQIVLAQVCMRCWETPQGQYPGNPNFGWYVGQLVNQKLDAQQIQQAQTLMGIAAARDQRIESVAVTITPIPGALVITSIITPEPLTGAPGQFTLTCQVSALTPSLVTYISIS
jgi:hypothetical protein